MSILAETRLGVVQPSKAGNGPTAIRSDSEASPIGELPMFDVGKRKPEPGATPMPRYSDPPPPLPPQSSPSCLFVTLVEAAALHQSCSASIS